MNGNIIHTTQYDLTSQVELTDVKANPSVYSPNDGGFNSEENMRWAVKKLATKPFIIGETPEIVKKSLQMSLDINTMKTKISDGMFSIDGYTIKLSNHEDISFDAPLNQDHGTYIENKDLQKFVSDISCYGLGKHYEIPSSLDEILLNSYKLNISPSEESWQDAVDNKKVIGFTRVVYTGDIEDLLTVEPSTGTPTKIYYNEGDKINVVGTDPTSGVYPVEDSSGKLRISNISLRYYDNGNKPFAIINGSDFNVYYPVYVYQQDNLGLMVDRYIVNFTDIFGLKFEKITTATNYTKTYPYTQSVYVDMDNNAPLASLGATAICNPTTFPTELYNWADLYTISGSTLSRRSNFDFSSTTTFPAISSLFNELSVSDLLSSTYMPQNNNITGVSNTLSYYCLKNVNTDHALKNSDNNTDIPVAFMMSNGELCTDGFVCDWTDTKPETYPVESFVHFIKRLVDGGILSLQSVYDTYIAKPVSYYLSLCYSSLMKNVVHASQGTDSLNIKSDGCGAQLATIQEVQNYDYFVTYDYQYTGYKKESNGFVTDSKQATLVYNKDVTSDNYKIQNLCNLSELFASKLDYLTVPTTIYDSMFDDPANYICKCKISQSSGTGLTTFNLYDFGNSETIPLSYAGYYIQLDENYLPKLKLTRSSDCGYVRNSSLIALFNTANYNTESLSKSLTYMGTLNGWKALVPQVISLTKDTLNYLCGRDVETGKYKGLNINSIFPGTNTNSDLYVCDAAIDTVKTTYVNDYEINKIKYLDGSDIPDKKFDVRRGAFLHISKIYGDNEQSLEDYINSILTTNIDELIRRIEALEDTVDGDGTGDNPGLKKIILGDTTLNINGLKNDVDDLKLRVTSLETRAGNTDLTLKNLTEASGKIGQNAMYIVKKFGATNITGYGSTFDFNMNMSKSEASSEPNIQSGISDLSVLCENDIITDVYISDKITRLGDKLLYHCAKLNSVNSGNIVSLSISEEQIESGVSITDYTVSTINKDIVPLTVLVTANGQTYHDDGIGNIYLTTDSNNIKGTINYKTGLITFNSLNNTSAFVKYKYYNAVTDGVVQRNTLPSSIQVLGDQVFAQDIDKGYKGTGITDITFPSGLKKIGSACFWGSALTTLNVPNSVTDVGQYVFSYSEDLTNVIYDGRVMGDYAFAFCTSLHDMQIGFSCLTIGRKCFTYCQNFENDKIVFIGDAYVWWNISKGEDWASKLGYITESISNINSIECYRTGSPNAIFTYERNYYLQNGYQYRLTTYGDITIPQITEGQPITQGFVFCENSDVLYVNPSTLTITNANLPVDISVGNKIPLYPFIDSVNVYTYNSETGQYEETAATLDQLSSINATYSYSSSDTSIARIIIEDETYKVEAMSSGTASIIVSANISGYTADLTISIDIN